MGPLTRIGERALILFAVLTLTISATYAQTPPIPRSCVTTAVPFQVRSEGLTERMGDIVLQCSGFIPGAASTGNFAVYLQVGVTNRIDSNGFATDAVFSIDYGLGFTPSPALGLVGGNNISFNGVSLTVPASGNFSIKISGLRGNVHQLGTVGSRPVSANLSVPLPVNQAQIIVAYATPGFYSTLY